MEGPKRDISKTRASTLLACGLLVAVLASLIALSSATPASADVQVCGKGEPTVPGGEPTYDLNGIQQETTQDNLALINEIRNALNANTKWCGPLEFATEVGADLVAGTVWELVDLNVPEKYDVTIAVARTLWEHLQGEAPSQAPAGAPSQAPAGAPSQLAQDGSGGSAVPASVAWTGGIGLHIRPSPDYTGASIGIVSDGATLSIGCTTTGETVSGPFGPTDLWDYVSYNGQVGYVSDGYLNTGTNDPVAPSCLGPL